MTQLPRFVVGLFKKYFSRQVYFLFIESFILTVIFFLSHLVAFVLPGISVPSIINYIFSGYFFMLLLYFLDVLIFQRAVKRRENIGGFKRWDGFFEIHIGDVTSGREFYKKLIRVLNYCKSKHYMVECIISDSFFNRYFQNYHQAILLNKPLTGYTFFIMRFYTLRQKSTTVLDGNCWRRVVLDPSQLSIKKLKNGHSIISSAR